MELLKSIDPSSISLLVLVILVIAVVWYWHLSDNSFNLQQCLLDSVTGKISVEKIGYMTALSLMSWGFVTLVLHDKITEWYAGLFGGLFVLGRAVSSGLSVIKDVKIVPPPQ